MWYYKGDPVETLEDIPQGTYGFIYRVKHKKTGREYIGKKQLFTRRNKKLGKKEYNKLKEERKQKKLRGKTPEKKLVVQESNWKDYYGSQKEIKELVKQGNKSDFEREILKFVNTKKLLTYYETKYLFIYEVLEKGTRYINNNIEGRYFKKDFL